MASLPVHLVQAVMKHPECPHLLRLGTREQADGAVVEVCQCVAGSELVSRPMYVTGPVCNVTCRLYGGPYMGRRQTPEEEQRWLMQAMNIVHGQFVSGGLLDKMLRKHEVDATIGHPPEPFLSALRAHFQPVMDQPEIENVCITGSLVIQGLPLPPKDVDVVLVVKDMRAFLTRARSDSAFSELINRPLVIDGHEVPMDLIPSKWPGSWFVSVDLWKPIVYRAIDTASRLAEGFTEVNPGPGEQKWNHFLDALRLARGMSTWEKMDQVKDQRMRDAIVMTHAGVSEAEAIEKSGGVFKPGDALSKIIKAVSFGALDSQKCGGCNKRREAMNEWWKKITEEKPPND